MGRTRIRSRVREVSPGKYGCTDILFRLAEHCGVVVMHGGGFGGADWSVRVSLANLAEDTYPNIGQFLRETADAYVKEWEATRSRMRRNNVEFRQTNKRGSSMRYSSPLRHENPFDSKPKILNREPKTKLKMKTTKKYLICLVSTTMSLFAVAVQAKPKIVILATGGTIGRTGQHLSGRLYVRELLCGRAHQRRATAQGHCRPSGEQVANIGSQTMNDGVWLKLAERINAVLAQPRC